MVMGFLEKTKGKLFRNIAGYACIVAGIAGCILPIIPGIPLLFLGLGLLAVHNPWAARLLERMKKSAGKVMPGIKRKEQASKTEIDPAA